MSLPQGGGMAASTPLKFIQHQLAEVGCVGSNENKTTHS